LDLNPFSGVAELIVGLKGINRVERWFRLMFSIGLSYWLAASTVTGTALATGVSVPVAVGLGLCSGAALGLVAYQRADKDLISGTVVVVPQKTVEDSVTPDGRGPMVSH
jgi:hypothetical protein